MNELQVDADSNKFRTLQKKRSQDSSQAIDRGYHKMLQPNRETMTSKVHSTPIKTQAESPVIALIKTFSEESKDDEAISPPINTRMRNIGSPTMRHRQLKVGDKLICETKPPKVPASGLYNTTKKPVTKMLHQMN